MLEIVPMTLKEANAFVEQKHRHHGKVVGHKFSIGASNGKEIVGVAIVGRPVARHLDDGWTLEVNRLCTDGTRNACLYMGVPLATGALKTCRTNVVGSGLKLKSQVDYEVLGMTEETSLQTVLIFPSRPQDTSAMKTSSACSGVICISARIVFIESG